MDKKTLALENAEGKTVHLTAEKLDALFANTELYLQHKSHETKGQDSHILANQFVNRFGLRTSHDVITFLNSKQGQILHALVGRELAELAAMQRFQERFHLEQQMRHRHLAFFLLGLIYEREAKNEKIMHMNEEVQRKSIEKSQESSKAFTDASKMHRPPEQLEADLQAYTEACEALEKKLEDKVRESEALDLEIVAFEKEVELGAKKHAIYERHVDEIFNLKLSDLLPDDNIDEDADLTIANIGSADDVLAERMPHLLASIETKIATLDATTQDTSSRIANLTPTDTEQALDLLQIHHGKVYQMTMLADFVDILSGRTTMYRADGSIAKIYREADFFVPREHKIERVGDQYYYLPASQNVHELSIDDKSNAQKQFESLKPTLRSVNKTVQHNKSVEQDFNEKRRSNLFERSKLIHDDILLLTRQLAAAEAARASTAALMQLKPQLQNSVKKPSNSDTAVADSSRRMLQLLLNSPSPSPDALKMLLNSMRADDPLTKTVQNLKANQPLPNDIKSQLWANRARIIENMISAGSAPAANEKDQTSIRGPLPTKPSPFSAG